MNETSLRIAFCHYSADVGGGSDRCLLDLVTHLRHLNVTPLMILRRGDPLAARYLDLGIDVRQLDLVPPRRALDPIKLLKFSTAFVPSILQMARILSNWKPHLVHVNTITNLQGACAARLARRPLVWHIREIGKGSWLDRTFIRTVRSLASHVVAVSPAVLNTLTGCHGKADMVFDGIDLSEYDPPPQPASLRTDFGIPLDTPLLAVVGRLEPWKGQHVVLEALPRVLKAYPRARLAIVGGPAVNKPEYADLLRTRCRELQLGRHVVFTGPVTNIPQWMAAADILVLPSVTPEPFGRTVIEAMAASKPVVATAAGGPLSTVVDGYTGRLVPPEDPASLAQQLIDLLARPEEAKRMGERGRLRAMDQFNLTRHVQAMRSLFQRVHQSANSNCTP